MSFTRNVYVEQKVNNECKPIQTESTEIKNEEKYYKLVRAIINISMIKDHLEELKDRISGASCLRENSSSLAGEINSLKNLLEAGPSIVEDHLESIHKVINEIKEILF